MIGANPKNNTKNITTACHRIPHLASAAPGMRAPKKQTAQFSDTTRLITPKPQYGTRESSRSTKQGTNRLSHLALETRLAAARYMATDEGFASSSALALVLGSRRDGEAEEKGGRLAELLGEGGKNRGGREGFAVRGFSRV